MLRLASLGFLSQEPLNGYRLKQQLETYMGSCICANYGAIYPLLKRMEEHGEITLLSEEMVEGGQSKKVYGITALGRERWREEMLANPHESWVNARSRFVIKFFFFSLLQPAERLQLIEHRLMICRLRLASKQAEKPATDVYQVTVQQRALEMIQSEIEWLTKQLAREQQELAQKIPEQ